MIKKKMICTDLMKNSLTGELPRLGNDVEYRGLPLKELALKLDLEEADILDILDNKRSYRPIDIVEEGKGFASNMLPYRPVHPGEMLKEEIEYRELNLIELAGQMGITEKELIEILDEKRPVTEDYAKKIEAANIGFTAQSLRNTQKSYDIEAVLIPLRDRWQYEKRLRKQQEKRATMQEWQHLRQAVPTKQRVAVRTPATVGRELVPV
jgi:addiction module HigA family antidote